METEERLAWVLVPRSRFFRLDKLPLVYVILFVPYFVLLLSF